MTVIPIMLILVIAVVASDPFFLTAVTARKPLA